MNLWIMIVCFILCCGILLVESIYDVKKKKVHILGAIFIGMCGVIHTLLWNMGIMGSFGEQSLLCINWKDMLCGAVIGIFFMVISFLTEEKLGKGDSLYLIALGMLLGFQKMMLLSMMALLLSALMGIVLLLLKKATRKTQLPFLPFLTTSFFFLGIFS